MEGVPDSRPVVTVSVQFPDLSVAEFDGVRSRLVAGRPGRIVVPHEAHRWYAAASDPETVRALVSALRAVVEGRKLSFGDEEALDDLSQEYADWLEESEDRDDAEPGPVMSFSVHLPALDRDEFAALADSLRAAHSRRIVLGEQEGLSHHELSERSRIAARMPGIRAALRGEPVGTVDALPLVALLNDYAGWLTAHPPQ
ncbi:Uncharacterised protein (plasmid) [Tsukamurella tyrosinosolvens]|uniref:Uncharacterized protein n=1 Tax=Tsukamurella tyrosinosolvens TaxID=57704 RepID=A0A1H4YX44_TSUTY|nr:hypothetical protein AXK58_22180 [Tsukamurella tyrosinosolvens]SED22393.1 hypothetical protein SAMN04489793_4346 [Tsukamurella tyrosinosolvens]VEH91337.1 Uncharacterised protein [Tsukamurella tyrosinosolvens]